MFLVHLDPEQSGLGPDCKYMRVEAVAFEIKNIKSIGTQKDTMTVVFYEDSGRPVNAYCGVKAVEEAKVQIT